MNRQYGLRRYFGRAAAPVALGLAALGLSFTPRANVASASTTAALAAVTTTAPAPPAPPASLPASEPLQPLTGVHPDATSTEYTESSCPGAIASNNWSLACMASSVTSTGAYWVSASFYNNPGCFSYYGGDYTGGYYYSGGAWQEGSGGQIWIDSNQLSAYYIYDLAAGTPVEVGTYYCPQELTLNY